MKKETKKAAKQAKILNRWSSKETQEDAQLKLDLSAAELQSKADLYQAEHDLLDAEKEAFNYSERLNGALGSRGQYWSPAEILGYQDSLEDANALVKERKGNITKLKAIIKEWL
jgi:hypothetical protein